MGCLFCKRNEIVYFDSFGVEYISEEIKEFIGNKIIKANIFREQANNSIMCGYFWILLINFMLTGKKLSDFTSLFSPYDFEKNDDIICLTDQTKYRLNEITKTENYFNSEINQKKIMQ